MADEKSSSSIQVLDANSPEYAKESASRPTRSRQEVLNQLREQAKKNGGKVNGVKIEELEKQIQTANENGQALSIVDPKSGVNFMFQPTAEQKKKAAEKAKNAEAKNEEEKKGFWERNGWLKWTLIIAGTLGVGALAYFVGKNKGKKDQKKADQQKVGSSASTAVNEADNSVAEKQIAGNTNGGNAGAESGGNAGNTNGGNAGAESGGNAGAQSGGNTGTESGGSLTGTLSEHSGGSVDTESQKNVVLGFGGLEHS